MSRIVLDILAFLVGIGLGVLFYGGLYLTLERLPRSANPGLLMLVSFLLRSVLVVGVLYLVMDHSPDRVFASFFGFILSLIAARLISSRRLSRSVRKPPAG